MNDSQNSIRRPWAMRCLLHRLTLVRCFTVICILAVTFTAIHGMEPPLATDTDYVLSWHTIDGGGGESSGGSFQVVGTIGQPDAGTMSGGEYTLAGGFWPGSTEPSPPPCLGDFNLDGLVDVSDLLALLAAWGSCPGCDTDLNGDGLVDVSDLLTVLAAWGACSD